MNRSGDGIQAVWTFFLLEFINMLKTDEIPPTFHKWIRKPLGQLSAFKNTDNKQPLYNCFHMFVVEVSQVDYVSHFGKEMVALLLQVFIWNGVTLEAIEKEVDWLTTPFYNEWDRENEWDMIYDVCNHYKNEMKASYGRAMLLHMFQKYHSVVIPDFQDVQSKDWLNVVDDLLAYQVEYREAFLMGLKFDVECMNKLDEIPTCYSEHLYKNRLT
jgi:hypothetical protein